MIGKDLGSYRITGRVGRGGMATVYRGVHCVLGHQVAIKLLNEKYADKSSVRKRFLNEAKAVANVLHIGIVRLFDFGFDDTGHAYIVMELLDGEPLSDRLKRGPIPEPMVSILGRQIAAALGHAHKYGVIHRDLKPDNIFLVKDDEVPEGIRAKILDFGIAKHEWDDSDSAEATREGALLGTPAYMSPEQCRDPSTVDHRTDVYSLGIVLYRMATGSLPFAGSSSGELIAKHQYVEPSAPRELASHVSIALNDLIVHSLSKALESRIQSMDEMGERLSELTGEEFSSENFLSAEEIYTSEDFTRPDSLEEAPVQEGSKLPTTLHSSVREVPVSAGDMEGGGGKQWFPALLIAAAAAVVGFMALRGSDEAPGVSLATAPALPSATQAASDAGARDAQFVSVLDRCRAQVTLNALPAAEVPACVLAACKADEGGLALLLVANIKDVAEREALASACKAYGVPLAAEDEVADAGPATGAKRPRRTRKKRRFDTVDIPIME